MTSGLFTLPLPSATADAPLLRDHSGEREVVESESFFAGPENALVRSIVRLVDGRFGHDHDGHLNANNPLVLYGPTGAGKSSLASALADRYRQRLQLDSVVITTGADLARSLAHAVETDSLAEHRALHHRCDLLLIDDLHRLANKPAAQQFLISTLNSLLKRDSLVIVTLPKSPHATAGLAPPLVSRLLGGLVVRLALPEAEARRAIVRQAANRNNLRLSDEQINRLSGSHGASADRYLSAPKIRQLVLQLAANAEFGQQPAASETNTASQHDLKQCKVISRRINTLVAKHFGLPVGELKSKSRRQAIADARGLAMYLVRNLTDLSFADVGRLYGGRDHTTVMHACRKVATQLDHNDPLRRIIDEWTQEIGAEGLV